MRTSSKAVAVLATLWAAVPVAAQDVAAADAPEKRVIEVRMVDRGPTEFVFDPARITVRPGDRVIWIQAGVMPHNVEFTSAPGEYDVATLPTSPFITVRGERFEVEIDDRFGVGRYEYVCTPHAAMGMRGAIEVVPANAVDTPQEPLEAPNS